MATPPPPTGRAAGSAQAYVTLFIGDSRSGSFDGLRVLTHTIRLHDPHRPLLVMVAGDGVTHTANAIACEFGDRAGVHTVHVPLLRSTEKRCMLALGQLSGRQLVDAFTAYNAWSLTQYERLLWVEPDQMVLRPLDFLWRWRLSEQASGVAAYVTERMPQCDEFRSEAEGWAYQRPFQRRSPTIKFNSGVVLMRPGNGTEHGKLLRALRNGTHGSYGCSDGFQTLWNRVIWQRLSCLGRSFNCIDPGYLHANASYGSYRFINPKLSCLQPNASLPHVIHFAADQKPWSAATQRKHPNSWSIRTWHTYLREYQRQRRAAGGDATCS